jgi:hypothetical protein
VFFFSVFLTLLSPLLLRLEEPTEGDCFVVLGVSARWAGACFETDLLETLSDDLLTLPEPWFPEDLEADPLFPLTDGLLLLSLIRP